MGKHCSCCMFSFRILFCNSVMKNVSMIFLLMLFLLLLFKIVCQRNLCCPTFRYILRFNSALVGTSYFIIKVALPLEFSFLYTHVQLIQV